MRPAHDHKDDMRDLTKAGLRMIDVHFTFYIC
jgi:hypothetical protein